MISIEEKNKIWSDLSPKSRNKLRENYKFNHKEILKDLFGEDNLISEKEPIKDLKPGDKVRLLCEFGYPEVTIKEALENGNYCLVERSYEYPRFSLISSDRLALGNGINLKYLEESLDKSLSIETKESLESWAESKGISLEEFIVGDYVRTKTGRKGKITETYKDAPDRVFISFLDGGYGGVVGIEDLEHEFYFRIGDEVEVVSGKFKGRTGIVEDIEYEEGYTVSVNIPDYGIYVHDSSYFGRIEKKYGNKN